MNTNQCCDHLIKNMVWTHIYVSHQCVIFNLLQGKVAVCCMPGCGKEQTVLLFWSRTHQRKVTPCKTPSSCFSKVTEDNLYPLSVNSVPETQEKRFMTTRKINKRLAWVSYDTFSFPLQSNFYSLFSPSANHLKYNASLQHGRVNASRRNFPC